MSLNLTGLSDTKKQGALFAPRFLCAAVLLCVFPLASHANTGVSTGAYAQLLMQLDQLQSEVQSLRNQVEQQERTIQQMQEQQRNRYLDLDQRAQEHAQRLTRLEEQRPTATQTTLPQAAVSAEPQAERVTPASGSSARDDREAYAEAYALVPERRFDEAIQAFQAFIRNYPDSRLVGNSYYWIGEIHLAQNRTQEAERMFDIVLQRFPDSFKVADSMYKLALIYSRFGDDAKARGMMEKILSDHPNEPAAALARSWLGR